MRLPAVTAVFHSGNEVEVEKRTALTEPERQYILCPALGPGAE